MLIQCIALNKSRKNGNKYKPIFKDMPQTSYT